MRNHSKFLGIIAMVAVMGLSLTGCQSTASNRVIGWSDHTFIPSKDYVVVGAVSLRDTNERTVIADLMDAAIEMGGHDIINVRMTETTTNIFGMRTGHQVMAATAVVIRFTDDTLIETDSQCQKTPHSRPIMPYDTLLCTILSQNRGFFKRYIMLYDAILCSIKPHGARNLSKFCHAFVQKMPCHDPIAPNNTLGQQILHLLARKARINMESTAGYSV